MPKDDSNVIRSEWPRIRRYMDQGKPLYQVDARKKGTNGKPKSFVGLEEAKVWAKDLAESIVVEGLEGMAVPGFYRLQVAW